MRKKTELKRQKGMSIKSKVIIISLFLLALVFNIYSLFFHEISKHTGFDVASTGFISLFIEGDPRINITDPLNITYNFSYAPYYPMNLNVTSDTPIDSWNYRLYDNKHQEWAGDWAVFSPNTSFNAVRWGNTINVVAYTPAGKIGRANQSFYISVPNSAPIIYNLNSTIQICEGQSLFYQFYAVDLEEDENPSSSGSLIHNIQPTYSRFFLNKDSWYRTIFNYSIFSGTMRKNTDINVNEGFRAYPVNISVNDGEFLDYKIVNITVIEKNNAPLVSNVSVKTIWNKGVNSTLYEVVYANDTEYDLGYGNLTFNISIVNASTGASVNLFKINYTNGLGIINFTADNSTPLGVYDVTFCANDTGLSSPHANISAVCGQTGLSMADCEHFELTITNNNRAPTITSHYPINLSFNATGTNNIYFNITTYDPDGTTPDAYWFVDGVLKEYDEGNLTDEFNYIFPCDILGLHNITVNITDGLLNDSLTWTIRVDPVLCTSPGGGGGGGGGPSALCSSKWGCDGWVICQNAKSSLESGLLSGEDYRTIKEICDSQQLSDEFCGFQIRDCKDVKQCFLSSPGKPEEVQQCYYTENPSCKDEIKNCHDGECELLVDCGGPCKACPTCTDKIKNQNEEGVDCGGSCPWRCKPSVPLLKRKEIIYGFLILLLLLIVLAIIRLVRVLRENKALAQQRRF